MSTGHPAKLAEIRRFDQLVVYLRDELDWPIGPEPFEDLTFDYTPEELGIDAKNAAKIQEIKRLRPLTPNQPWGIFFVKFEPKRLPVVALRRILSRVALNKRGSANDAERRGWEADDLLFVSNYGEGESRQISLAHFSQNEEKKDLPTLKVLGWDNLDTPPHLDHVADRLTDQLTWPADEKDEDGWRRQWRSAFTLRHREVINTSKKLSIELAALARDIRARINTVLAIETEDGPIRKLMAAFKEALVHDLDEDRFADMYAQTIAYGLLSARVANPSGGTADDVATAMPVTNPFLKELMTTFLDVGGRTGEAGSGAGLDFDELGVGDIVELLDAANMEAVVRDFGDKNPQEDPVIHFYELFLKEYDAEMRVQRGVFYTPRPIVSFIVRSVDELLRSEFGLEDGLADTTTWGEMAGRIDDLEIPEGATATQAFVQILDPATGTGTFLVEVIDLIHKTMTAKWQAKGHGNKKIEKLWNAYVPEHLLPRLHGYELMMAPYAIAHMKIGLKLHETGYRFESDERARVYLTNALEPAQDFSGTLAFAIPALAHEAEAVNAIKRDQRFTVVIGNPPYAGIPSNVSESVQSAFRARLRDGTSNYFEIDGESLGERNPKWVNDDYVKFVRLAQTAIADSAHGIVGVITNHGFLLNPTFRGMRCSLMKTFERRYFLDLHGNLKRRELAPSGEPDANVFDIQQGVAISLLVSRKGWTEETGSLDLWSESRDYKYRHLSENSVHSTSWTLLSPDADFYLFVPQDDLLADEYASGVSLSDLFGVYGAGMTTAHDAFVIDWSRESLIARMEEFRIREGTPAEVCNASGVAEKKGWDVHRAQADLGLESDLAKFVEPVQYRPFDHRLIFYHDAVVWRTVRRVMGHMRSGKNLALISARSNKSPQPDHFFCTRNIMETKCGEASTQSCLFPLHLFPDGDELDFESSGRAVSNLDRTVIPRTSPCSSSEDELIFHWIYALVFAPSYRERFAEFFKMEFPRVFFPEEMGMLRAMASLGEELIALHLMESSKLGSTITVLVGSGESEVEKVSYSEETVWIDRAKTRGFKGVPEEVWNFHIGGYQVCHKWLKDRQAKGGKNPRSGRVLTAEDIEHYQKIVVALSETIRIMAEIDEVIEEHGGWPGAFQGEGEKEPSESPKRPVFGETRQ